MIKYLVLALAACSVNGQRFRQPQQQQQFFQQPPQQQFQPQPQQQFQGQPQFQPQFDQNAQPQQFQPQFAGQFNPQQQQFQPQPQQFQGQPQQFQGQPQQFQGQPQQFQGQPQQFQPQFQPQGPPFRPQQQQFQPQGPPQFQQGPPQGPPPTPQISWGKCPSLEPSEAEKQSKAGIIQKCLGAIPPPENVTQESVEQHRTQIASCALQQEGWFDTNGGYRYDKAETEIKNKRLTKQVETQVLEHHASCKQEAVEKFTKSAEILSQIQLYQACMDFHISQTCGIEVTVPGQGQGQGQGRPQAAPQGPQRGLPHF